MPLSGVLTGPPERPARAAHLECIRAAGSLMVILYHALPPGATGLIVDAIRLGWLSMDYFFALSGFLIGRILLNSRTRSDYYSHFYRRRAQRIMPLYYLALAFIVVVSMLSDGGSKYAELIRNWGSPWWYAAFLANIPGSLTGKWPPISSLMPLWSLQVEMQFYLLIPLAIRHFEGRRLRLLMWALALASPLLRAFAYWMAPGNVMIPYTLLPCRMEGFAFGILVAEHLSRGASGIPVRRITQLAVAAGALTVITAVIGGFDWETPFNRVIVLSVAAAAAALLTWRLAIGNLGSVGRWVTAPAVMMLGRISFGTYVLHTPVFAVLSRVIARVAPAYKETVPEIIVGVAATIAVAWTVENIISYLQSGPLRQSRGASPLRRAA